MGYKELYEKIGYTFCNENLIVTSLTHASFNNEKVQDYTRLEFLGDSLLEFITSEYLYNNFKNASSGELTDLRKKFVSNKNLISISKELGLEKLLLKNPKFKLPNTTKVYADLFEALLAAIYLDSNDLKTVKNCFNKLLMKDHISQHNNKSYSVLLNEYLQKNKVEIKSEWEEKNHEFTCKLLFKDKVVEGKGNSKKEAKEYASKELFKKYIKNCR